MSDFIVSAYDGILNTLSVFVPCEILCNHVSICVLKYFIFSKYQKDKTERGTFKIELKKKTVLN